MTTFKEDSRLRDIKDAGCLRLALFLPQYAETDGGCLRPIGAGVVAEAVLDKFVTELGVRLEITRQPTPHGAVEALNNGVFDTIILGINGGREQLIDFAPTLFRFDFAYMVSSASDIKHTSEVDRSGVKIAVPIGHASWMELKKITQHAEIIATELPVQAFEMLRDGCADVFALPREQLIDFSNNYSGARILKEGFGYNDVGLAVAKGRTELCHALSEYTELAKKSGLVQDILNQKGLSDRGFTVPL